MAFDSPLRYPGGKGRLTNFFRALLERNRLTDAHYAEPYCGGAGMALSLLFLEYVSEIHLNDLHKPVYAFWHTVVSRGDELIERIQDCDVTIEEWQRQREVRRNAETVDLVDLGFSTFFLNRTNRSGILWGGPIGGRSQDGRWKLDARFNKADLIKRVRRIRRYRDRIHIHQMDAEAFIRSASRSLPRKAIFYCDPPYYRKGGELYEHHYVHEDHVRVADTIKGISGPSWVVSYDNTPEIQALYAGHAQLTYRLSYSAQDRYQGSELMVFGPGLTYPQVPNPATVTARQAIALGARPTH